jgi:acyl carrier protein
MNDVETTIRAFMMENFAYGDQAEALDRSESLLEAGLIDSTGVLELVAFLEQRFELRVADEEIVPANLDTIAGIAAYVRRKLGAELVA